MNSSHPGRVWMKLTSCVEAYQVDVNKMPARTVFAYSGDETHCVTVSAVNSISNSNDIAVVLLDMSVDVTYPC